MSKEKDRTPILECRALSFCYPQETENAIEDISFQVMASEFVLLCGQSGCGKTTLLRHMKKNQIPFGTGKGQILFCGEELEEMSDRESAVRIGYVGQNPQTQIVTDRVWHELAFGLENLGLATGDIRRRISETAAYFGMESMFRLPTAELSGGQKQMLNLAAVLVMKPELLILDEPTAMLDPIGAMRFLDCLQRLNREFGVTIVLSEQRLEEVLPMADRVLVMDGGRLLGQESPAACMGIFEEYRRTEGREFPVYDALPVAMRVWRMAKQKGRSDSEKPDGKDQAVPVSLRQGQEWLRTLAAEGRIRTAGQKMRPVTGVAARKKKKTDIVLWARELCFGYRRGLRILEDFSLEVERGSLFAILGGNGSGKTTALKVMMKLLKPWSGSVRHQGRMRYLAQDPMSLFSEISVEDELMEVLATVSGSFLPGETGETARRKAGKMLDFLELNGLEKRNPLDLSGGEKQRLALGKLLMTEPDILLLDEPTKGLDAAFKEKLAGLLQKLCAQGKTIVLVSHDMEFCGRYATHCGLLFDGTLMGAGRTRDFFAENSWYVTAAGRMSRGILEGCIRAEDIAGQLITEGGGQ